MGRTNTIADTSLRKTARIAGLLYVLMTIAAVYGLIYVRSQIMVRGDDIATFNNILSNEFLFRTGIVSAFISSTLFLLLGMMLYRLFKQVNEHQAKLMVVLVIVSIPIGFLIGTFDIASLMILKGEVLNTFALELRQDVALLFLKLHRYGQVTQEIFWGLWLIPFGLLVYRSGFIPRILGVLLIINSFGYLIESFTFLLFPSYFSFIKQFTFILLFVGEPPIMLWLLIIGIKVRSGNDISTKAVVRDAME